VVGRERENGMRGNCDEVLECTGAAVAVVCTFSMLASIYIVEKEEMY
jgi:hypothetical protein